MHTVADILASKATPADVETIGPDESVLDAARHMNERHIGALMVREKDALAGIVTERDILTKLVAGKRDPEQTRVRDIMTDRVVCCTPSTTLDELRNVMREKRIRHMPVLDGTKLVGMVSIGDLNFAENTTLNETIRYLEEFLSHG